MKTVIIYFYVIGGADATVVCLFVLNQPIVAVYLQTYLYDV